ncbi:MAG: amino acid ABC transporter substrate-binding protein [Clostridia bacterium]|nr:amino acid ABC transporter substrate-binding protein [Clostridia bacterium]
MKRVLVCRLVVLLLLSLCGCQKTVGTSLKDLQRAGKLTVAVSPDCSPYITLGEDGRYTGIEVDLLSMVCDELGVLLDIQAVEAHKVLPGVEAGKYDLGAGTVSDMATTGSVVAYSNAYAKAPQRLLIKPGTSIPDVHQLAQKVIAVRHGTYATSYCISNGIPMATYGTYEEAVEAVLDGTADGLLVDEYIARELMKTYTAETPTLALAYDPVDTCTYAFAAATGSGELLARINQIISELLAEGTLHWLYEQYGLTYTSPLG